MEVPTDGSDELLASARTAYASGDWPAAHRKLTQARALSNLATGDLSLLSSSAWWVGQVKESLEMSEEVYQRLQDDGDVPAAAMQALHLAQVWFIRGDVVIASGWVNRARRALELLPEGTDHGYLLYLEAALAVGTQGFGPAREAAVKLRDLGRRLRAPALTSFAPVLSGLADVRSGRTGPGFAQLDEAMLPVLASQLPPEWAGEVYCVVIHTCHDLGDIERMRAWIQATEQWREQFPGEVVYSGICRVHRLQVLNLEGGWDVAETAIEQTGAELIGRNNWVAGEAFYQLGEIRWRVRGCSAPPSKSHSLWGSWMTPTGCAPGWRRTPTCSPPPASARGHGRGGPRC